MPCIICHGCSRTITSPLLRNYSLNHGKTQRALRQVGWIKIPSSNRSPPAFYTAISAPLRILPGQEAPVSRCYLKFIAHTKQSYKDVVAPFDSSEDQRNGLVRVSQSSSARRTSAALTRTLPRLPSSLQVARQEIPDHERNETKCLLSVVISYPFCEIFFFPLSFCAVEATGTSTVPPAASASTPPPCSIFVLASRKNMTSLT